MKYLYSGLQFSETDIGSKTGDIQVIFVYSLFKHRINILILLGCRTVCTYAMQLSIIIFTLFFHFGFYFFISLRFLVAIIRTNVIIRQNRVFGERIWWAHRILWKVTKPVLGILSRNKSIPGDWGNRTS